MKKLLALAAVLATFASVSYAQTISLKNFQLYGEGQIIGTNNGNTGNVKANALLGLTFDVANNVKAAMALGYSSFWGENQLSGKPIDMDILGATPSDGYLNTLRVVELNLTVDKLFNVDGLNTKIGRQFYGSEDSTVMYFGVRHGGNSLKFGSAVTSLDALTVNYDTNNVKASAIYAQMNENVTGTMPHAPELTGVDVKVSNIAKMVNVEAYVYDAKHPTFLAVNDYGIMGIKPSVQFQGLTASLELARNSTSNIRNLGSSLIKFDVAYDIKEVGLTPRFTYFAAGGAGKSFVTFGNYVPGIVGFNLINQDAAGNNTITYSNAQVVNIGVDYNSIKNLVLSLDYFHYSLRDNPANVGGNGELALQANYALNDNIGLYAGVGEYIATNVNFGSDGIVRGGVSYKLK